MALFGHALLPVLSRLLIAAGWLAFLAFLLAQGNRPAVAKAGAEVKRDPISTVGIAFQGLAFAAVWMIERPLPRAGATLPAGEIALDVLAPLLSIASGWIGVAAVRTLGREWSYAARLVEGHRLVVTGPYRWVRHPIYAAMLGKLIATNFAFGHWLGLVIAVPIFGYGTFIRVRAEERLLRGQFGHEYAEYAKRVRAVIPGVF